MKSEDLTIWPNTETSDCGLYGSLCLGYMVTVYNCHWNQCHCWGCIHICKHTDCYSFDAYFELVTD